MGIGGSVNRKSDKGEHEMLQKSGIRGTGEREPGDREIGKHEPFDFTVKKGNMQRSKKMLERGT
jgi:hypothetical protein